MINDVQVQQKYNALPEVQYNNSIVLSIIPMPRTENQKAVAAYLPLTLYDKLEQFKLEEDLRSDSKAINTILERWFFGEVPIPAIAKTNRLEERLSEVERICETLIDQVFKLSFRSTTDGEIPDIVPSDVPGTTDGEVPDIVPSDVPGTTDGEVPDIVPSDVLSIIDSEVPDIVPSDVLGTIDSGVPNIVSSDVPSTIDSGVSSDVLSIIDSKVPSIVSSDGPSTIDSEVPNIVPSDVLGTIDSEVPNIVPSDVLGTIDSGVPNIVPSDVPSTIDSGVSSDVLSIIDSKVPSIVSSDVPSTIDSGVSRDLIITDNIAVPLPENLSQALSESPIELNKIVICAINKETNLFYFWNGSQKGFTNSMVNANRYKSEGMAERARLGILKNDYYSDYYSGKFELRYNTVRYFREHPNFQPKGRELAKV